MNQKNNFKFTAIVAVSFSVLLIAAIIFGLASGYLRLSKQSTSANLSVCNSYIEESNKILTHQPIEEQIGKYKALSSKVSAVDGSQSDPTCLYMQYVSASYQSDSAAIIKLGGLITDLAAEGKYVSGALDNLTSNAAIKRAVDMYSGSGDKPSAGEDQEVKGNG